MKRHTPCRHLQRYIQTKNIWESPLQTVFWTELPIRIFLTSTASIWLSWFCAVLLLILPKSFVSKQSEYFYSLFYKREYPTTKTASSSLLRFPACETLSAEMLSLRELLTVLFSRQVFPQILLPAFLSFLICGRTCQWQVAKRLRSWNIIRGTRLRNLVRRDPFTESRKEGSVYGRIPYEPGFLTSLDSLWSYK